MMTIPPPHTAQIRLALNRAFDDTALSAFCFDYFIELRDKFSRGMRKDETIHLLLDHCHRQPSGFETLLANVRQAYSVSNAQRKELLPLIDALSAYTGKPPTKQSPAPPPPIPTLSVPTTPPVENPYKPGRWVTGERFYGRQRILSDLEGGHYRGAYIIGTRQIGKTSLLRELERRLPALYLDVSYIGHKSSQWDKALRRAVKRKRRVYSWLPESPSSAEFFDLLEKVADTAEDHQQLVWLLLDEAEALMDLMGSQPHFLAKLRGATEMLPNLRLVLAGYRSLLELRHPIPPYYPSPLLGGFTAFILPPLSVTEATALIRQEKRLPTVHAEQSLIERILVEAGGHPFLLQRLCNYLWQAGTLHPLDKKLLHKIDADADNIFPADFQLLSSPEQETVRAYSLQGEAKLANISGQVQYQEVELTRTQHKLLELGFLRQTSIGYTISSQILLRWITNANIKRKMPPPISDPNLIDLSPIKVG